MIIITGLLTLVHKNKSETVETLQTKPLQKPGREKALNFAMSINTMFPNY